MLASPDLDVVLSVLNLLYVFGKRSNFISRLPVQQRNNLNSYLEFLGEVSSFVISLSIYPSICQSIHSSSIDASIVHSFIFPSIHPSIHPSINSSIHCPFIHFSIRPFIHPFIFFQTWGGDKNGFGLAQCCRDITIDEFPSTATSVYFEYQPTDNEVSKVN